MLNILYWRLDPDGTPHFIARTGALFEDSEHVHVALKNHEWPHFINALNDGLVDVDVSEPKEEEPFELITDKPESVQPAPKRTRKKTSRST